LCLCLCAHVWWDAASAPSCVWCFSYPRVPSVRVIVVCLCVPVQSVARGVLSKSHFPYQGSEVPATARISTVVVFIVGGATYEEVRCA
jgi:hypothetical protein